MATLILLVLAAIGAAFFATQNTGVGSLTFAGYQLEGIPMYLIILGSILIGLLLSAVISFVNSVTSSLEIHGKDVKISQSKKTMAELTKQIHRLELENTELKTELDRVPNEKNL